MKRNLFLSCFLLFTVVLLSPSQQNTIDERLVLVPLRVFDGSRFVDDLTINSLELLEDGRPQKIKALYLTKNTTIECKCLSFLRKQESSD